MGASDPRAALAAAARQSGDSLSALSRMLGRNEAYLQQFVTRGSPRRLAEADRRLLADHLGLDEVALGADPTGPGAVRVTRLAVSASAGPGSLVDGDLPAGSDRFDPALIARLRLDPATARTLRVRGSSMEPGILDGDVILVDGGDRRVAAGTAGAVFLIRIGEAIMVKRVRREASRLVASSDNPAADPLPDHAPGELTVIGRVVWLSRSPR